MPHTLLAHFRFEPPPRCTRAIAEILPVRDNTLELQLAGVVKDEGPIALHMLDELKTPSAADEQFLEFPLRRSNGFFRRSTPFSSSKSKAYRNTSYCEDGNASWRYTRQCRVWCEISATVSAFLKSGPTLGRNFLICCLATITAEVRHRPRSFALRSNGGEGEHEFWRR
jgi:hypothetical protein